MKVVLSVVVLVLVALVGVAYAWQAPIWWSLDDARRASKIEMKFEPGGVVVDFAYQVDPAIVPPHVRDAMEKKYPGLKPIAAEKGWEGGLPFYELTVNHSGKRVEATFMEGGELRKLEIGTTPGDPKYPVPDIAQIMVAKKYPDGKDVTWEVILLVEGDLENVLEYHAKFVEHKGTPKERRYKVIVLPGGILKGAYLEIAAELEVPAHPR